MAIRNIKLVRAEDMSETQRQELGLSTDKGLIAIETHNSDYHREAKLITGGILGYLWSLEGKEIKEALE